MFRVKNITFTTARTIIVDLSFVNFFINQRLPSLDLPLEYYHIAQLVHACTMSFKVKVTFR